MVDQPDSGAELVDLDESAGQIPARLDPNVVELPDDDTADDFKLPSHAKQREDGSIYLPLSFPVTLKFKKGGVITEERITELTFHRLNGKDMQVIAEKPPGKVPVTAMARSTRIPEMKFGPIYERMDGRDIDAAGRCVMHFTDGGRPTGR